MEVCTAVSPGRPLNLLLVEDSLADAELIVRELRQAGYDLTWERVETERDMRAALAHQSWDVVLADYVLPEFSGPEALALLQEHDRDPPFIIVSGAVGEDVAVAVMKAGAHDYVMKDNLRRLVPAIEREVRDAAIRRRSHEAEEALRSSEERYRDLVENAKDMIYVHDMDGNFQAINRAAEGMSGYTREESMHMGIADILPPEQQPIVLAMLERHRKGEGVPNLEVDLVTKDGRRMPVEVTSQVIWRDGMPVGVQGTARDLTERKRAEQKTVALLEIAKSISGTLDQQELLDRVQRQTVAVLGCDRVATFLLDIERGVVRVASHFGLSREEAVMSESLAFSPGELFPLMFRQGQTLVVDDPSSDSPRLAELCAGFGVQALIAVPLRMRGRYLGVFLVANTRQSGAFAPEQVDLCEGIARQLAVAIESVDLYRDQQEQAQVSGFLARVGQELISALDTPVLLQRLCRLVADGLGCDMSCTILCEPETNQWRLVSFYDARPEGTEVLRTLRLPSDSFSGVLPLLENTDVVRVNLNESSNPFVVELASHLGVKAVLYTALRRGEEIIGLQAAGYRDDPGVVTWKQQRVAGGIAQLASLALDNARLVAELDRASRLKSEFVATMSHELRTPLNIIMGYNDLMQNGDLGEVTVEQRDAAERIDKSARNLLDLITSTLDLSRLEAGRMTVETSEVRVADMLHTLEAETRELHSKPGVQRLWDVAEDLPLLQTDAGKLKTVLKNLIVNALKFTDQGNVTIRARTEDGGVAVEVSDTGAGIATETLPTIFDPFRQGDGSMTRRHGGVGLGLYIVRRFLDLLDGTITVETAPDSGSTFRVWVPARAPAVSPPPIISTPSRPR